MSLLFVSLNGRQKCPPSIVSTALYFLGAFGINAFPRLALRDLLGMHLRLVSSIPVEPSLEVFVELAKRGNVVPVYTQLAADFETPLSAYLKLRDSRHSFFLKVQRIRRKAGMK